MNANGGKNDTLRRLPRRPLPSVARRPIMSRVSAIVPHLKRRFLALALIAAVLAVYAVACGGDEEVVPDLANPADPVTPTPLLTPAPAPDCPPPSPGPTPPPVEARSYEQLPALTINQSRLYLAHVYSTRGHFIIELLPQFAPEHVNSFIFLARERFFNGTAFHRVVPGFVAQGGDPTGTGSGGPGYTVPLEPSDQPFVRGIVGMARSQDPNSAGSQWFVTLGDAPHLNGEYTVFGRVTLGMEIVDCIQVGDAIVSLDIQEL
jgi:peptidylprolyl isomerase